MRWERTLPFFTVEIVPLDAGGVPLSPPPGMLEAATKQGGPVTSAPTEDEKGSPSVNQYPGQQPGVPIIGQQKPQFGTANIVAFVRELNQQGVFPLEDGRVPREAFLDASELVAMLRDEVRRVVREELAVAIVTERESR